MIDIAKKKLPFAVVTALVYLSYCATSWYGMRGNLAYYGYNLDFPAWFTNDAWAFFLGGIFPLIIYTVCTLFIYRTLPAKTRGGNVSALRYGISLTVIAANVVLFALKFVYIAAPLYAPVLDIMLDPIVTVLFVSLYMVYAYKIEYVEKPYFHVVLTQVLGAFVAVYGLLSIFNIITVLA